MKDKLSKKKGDDDEDFDDEDGELQEDDDLEDDLLGEDTSADVLGDLDATGDVDVSDLADATGDIDLEAELEDVTGDIDTSGLEDDLADEIDDEDEDEDEEDEEGLSKKDEIIAKISEKLPFLGKLLGAKTSDDDDEDEEDEKEDVTQTQVGSATGFVQGEDLEEPEWLIKVKEKAPFLAGPLEKVNGLLNKKKASSGDDDDDDEEDDEDGEEKPKKKLKVIHIVIIVIVLAAVVLSEEEGAEGDVKNAGTEKKVPAKKTPPKTAPTTAPKTAPKTPSTTADTSTPTKTPDPPKVEPPKLDPPKADPPKADPPKTATTTTPKVDPPADSTDDEFDLGADLDMNDTSSDDLAVDTTTNTGNAAELDDLFDDEDDTSTPTTPDPPKPEPKVEKIAADTTTKDMVGEVKTQPDTMLGETSGMGEDDDDPLTLGGAIEDELLTNTNDNSAITNDILKKLEVKTRALKDKELLEKATSPTDPPEYINPGSSLVYNCAGGHWACIDAKDFQTCESNYAWNLKQGLTIQCYPTQVYQSEDDCIALQQYRIDSVSKTDFCN